MHTHTHTPHSCQAPTDPRTPAAGEPLLFGEDVNAARYVDGERETPNEEVADAGTIKQLFLEGGCTMQVCCGSTSAGASLQGWCAPGAHQRGFCSGWDAARRVTSASLLH